jgi:acetate kinase
VSRPILVLDCGSSSIKFALFAGDTGPLPRAAFATVLPRRACEPL